MKGTHIEVLIRYDGQEWLAAAGTVEQVTINNEFSQIDDGFELTGRRTLSIDLWTVRRDIRADVNTSDPKLDMGK